MKSRIVDSIVKEENGFPCLMIFKRDRDFVVLFTSETSGIAVYSTTKDWEVGESSGGLLIHEFIPFNGEIILSN